MTKNIESWVGRYKDDFGFMPLRAARPTSHKPGTPMRIEVMRRRVEEGSPIFVDGDNSFIPIKMTDNLSGTVMRGTRECGGQYSLDYRFQYRIWRRWGEGPIATFIQLRPEGIHEHNAMTPGIRKYMAFCLRHGCGGMDIVSLFALRCASYAEMTSSDYAIGDHCDRAIRFATERSSFTVACWGAGGCHQYRGARILCGLRKRVEAKRILCFGLTKPFVSPIKPIDDVRVEVYGDLHETPFVEGEVVIGKWSRDKTEFIVSIKRRGYPDQRYRIPREQTAGVQRMVRNPVRIDEAGSLPVTIQLPFAEVDFNDVDIDDIADIEEEDFSE